MTLEEKIKTIERDVTDPNDIETIKEWRESIAKTQQTEKFYSLKASKYIAQFLADRIKGIKIQLATKVGMEKDENLAWHARLEENEALIAFFVRSPKKELQQLEEEVDSYL